MTKRYCFSFFAAMVLSLFSVNVFAQNVQVSGKVTEGGEPLAGASVFVQGTATGVISDIDGSYTISAPKGSVLEFSFIGYVSEYRKVEADAVIDVEMHVDSELLAETIVVGYGVSTKKKDLSASVGVIQNVESLSARPVASTEGMLQGQVAGVVISSNGGSPTSTPSVVIRGQGSRNGDSVLWVVDGIPGAPLNSTNDIESIVVLKDAASAAIYGAQSGAGGVILVTTKKASQKGVSVEYDGVSGVRNATNLPTPLDAQQEIEMRKLSYANAGLTLPNAWNPSKNPWISTTRTDWMDEIFRTSLFQRHSVSLNAVTDKSKNRLTFNLNDNPGVLVSTYSKDKSIRYNGSFQINDWVTLTEDFSWSQKENRGVNTSSAYSGAVLSAVYMPASAEARHADGTYGGTTTEDPAYEAQYGSLYADAHGDAINPLRILEANNTFNRTDRVYSTTGLEIANIVKGLKFNSRFTYDLSSNFYKTFSPMRPEIGKPDLSNSLSYSATRSNEWKTENTLTYDRTFGKHNVSALLSTTANSYVYRYFDVTGNGLDDESANLQYISFASNVSSSDAYAADANVAVVARLGYSYDDRYFVTASIRRDYAGRLPQGANYGDFPALTGAWKVSNEKFFPKNDILTFLKLRASWGLIGNLGSVPMNYKSADLSKSVWNEGAIYGIEKNTLYGTFWYAGKALNRNLTWETSRQADLGVDFEMFNSRLTAGVDYYNKLTYNLIQAQTTGWPQTIGVDPMYVNQGEISNKGVEIQLGWADKINADWSYFVNANYSYNNNKVVNTGVMNDDGTWAPWVGDGSYRNVPYMFQTTAGLPLGSFYVIKTDGIFQSDAEAAAYVKDGKRIQPDAQAGDLKFVDYNNDGKIDSNDRQYVGNSVPPHTFALTGGFTWKKLSASMMLQGVAGGMIAYMGKYSLLSDVEGEFNRSADILNAWSPTNKGSNIPRLSKVDNNGNFTTASDWYLENSSYLRIKNITVSYDLTDVIRKCSHFNDRGSSLSVYFSGENLFTFTKYSGMDPETGGWDALNYPVSRVLSLGIRLNY